MKTLVDLVSILTFMSAPPDALAQEDSVAKDEQTEAKPLVPRHETLLLEEHEVGPGNATFQLGEGLVVRSKNGRFELATRLRAQFRYSIVHDPEQDALQHGFQIRRARLVFGGHFFNEHNNFKVELAISPRDTGFNGESRNTPLLDWYVEFDYLRDLTVRVGQYKVPFNRQRVISSGNLQLVDRSLGNAEFTLDRDVGLDVRSKNFLGLERLRYYAGVFMGEGRDTFELEGFELMYLGRIEVLPFGLFDDYEEADFERSRRPRLSLGAAYAFVDDATGNRGILGRVPTDGGTTDYHNVTADFMFKMAGASLSGEFYYRRGKRKYGEAVSVDDAGMEMPAAREMARNGLGWFVQGGYLVPRIPFEVASRYSQVRPLGQASSLVPRHELGGGVSYYFAQHPLKLQLDYFRTWVEGMAAQGEDEVRLQLQAAF